MDLSDVVNPTLSKELLYIVEDAALLFLVSPVALKPQELKIPTVLTARIVLDRLQIFPCVSTCTAAGLVYQGVSF